MKTGSLYAIFLIAIVSVSTGASAQKVYRCGQIYSQTPCAGGELVDAADARTPAQQKQTRQVAKRDAQAASDLEKARLKQEKADLAANTRPAPTTPPANLAATAPVSPASKPKKDRKSEPEYFTAQAPTPPKTAKTTAPEKPAAPASSSKKSP